MLETTQRTDSTLLQPSTRLHLSKQQAAQLRLERRQRAYELRQLGWQQAVIATALNVSLSTVKRWLKAADPKLPLRRLPDQTATHELSEEQKQRLQILLQKPPSAYGIRADDWTPVAILTLVRQAFANPLPIAYLGHLLLQFDPKMDNCLRQLQCWERKRQGWSVQAIADHYGLSREAVERALPTTNSNLTQITMPRKPAAGPPSKLTAAQIRELPELLLQPPRTYGLAGETWTRKKIAELIKQVYQVEFNYHYITGLLRRVRRRLRIDLVEHDEVTLL